MSLLSELDDAELVVADEDLGLMFVWYGEAAVRVLDEEGNERGYFTIGSGFGRKLTVPEVRRTIAAWRADLESEEETDS